VFSPTDAIATNISGKYFLSKDWLKGFPCSISFFVFCKDSSIRIFPTVDEDISIALIIGTPALIRVAKVLANFAKAPLCNIFPIKKIFRKRL
jgi:hypothetical protein